MTPLDLVKLPQLMELTEGRLAIGGGGVPFDVEWHAQDCRAYTNRNTDFTEKFAVRVDVTEEFPFLVTKLSPYYKVEAAS